MSRHPVLLCFFALAATIGNFATLQAQAPFQIVVLSGDLAPNVGTRLGFIRDAPIINNAGQVAFDATVDSDPTLLFGDVNGLAHVYRWLSVAPDGDGLLASAFDTSLNDMGQVALTGSLFNTANNSQIFRYDSAFGLTSLASRNAPAPGGNGTLDGFEFTGAFDLNNQGQVAFGAQIADTVGGSSDDYGIYLTNNTGIVEIVREGNPSPGDNEEFASLRLAVTPSFPLNNNGQVAFVAEVRQIGSNFPRDDTIFIGTGSAPATQVAREGDLVAGTNFLINRFGGLLSEFEFGINDQGDVLFAASATDISTGFISEGLFRGNENGITAIAMQGDVAPNSSDTFERLTDASINEAGQVLFRAALSTEDSSGIFLGDGQSPPESIAQTGQSVPNGNGVFTRFNFGFPENIALNNNGEVAFAAGLRLADGSGSNGIFFYGANGLTEIVRSGDPLLGSTFARLRFAGSSTGRFDDQSGLSDSGLVAFSFELADGRLGVAIASTGGELLGDVNRDSAVDFLDLGPFIELLSSGTFQFEADMTQDGNVDFLDLGPFIEALSS